MKRAIVLLSFILPAIAFAQLGADVGSFALSVSPDSPRPGSVVTITPQSSSLDLTNSTLTLSVNGKNVYSGDAQSVSVPIGGVGQTTTVRGVLTSGGQTYSSTVSLSPGDVSLVLEPLSSAPALYAGKPLTPQTGLVRVVAVADLRTSPSGRLDPTGLSYTWTVDGTTLANASGVGKTSIVVQTPLQYRSEQVSVKVQSRGGSIVGGDSITFSSQSPTVRIYQDDPLSGILFDRALAGSFRINGSEATLFAAPYSFSLAGGLSLTWFLNGSSAQAGSEITLRPQGNGQGNASLSVTAKNLTNESAETSLSLIFGAAGSGLFGL